MAKNKKAPVVFTRDEQIQQALTSQQKSYYTDDNYSIVPEVPVIRHLKVGDKVEIGNLEDCVVCYITDDQKFVVVDHVRVDNNYGNPTRTPAIGCWAWYNVFLLSEVKDTGLANNTWSLINRMTSSSLDHLIHKVLYFGVNPNPDYQRDYVWSERDEIKLIDSIFRGNDIGKFVFLKYDWPVTDVDVLDGKQRLNTIIKFITSRFPYEGYYWHQFSTLDRHRFNDLPIQYAELNGNKFTEADKLRLFLNANAAGVPQDELHLLKIRKRLQELENG